MATKFAEGVVSSINKSTAPEQLRRLASHCIKQAYAGNTEDTQYSIDGLPKWAQTPFVSYMKRVGGLDIQNPAAGSSRFFVVGVKNPKAQAKAIAASNTEAVMVAEHAIKQAPKAPKEMPAADRAQKAMESVIARMKKIDPDAAALINDVWAQRTRLIEALMEEQKPAPLRKVA